MDLQQYRFTLTSSSGEALFCDARLPARLSEPVPAVVFAHGFKGFKDWGSHPYVCESLARRGFYVLSFNFSHSGVDGHSQEFARLDRFEDSRPSRDVSELIDVVDAVGELRVRGFEHIIAERIGILGHSRGGGIAILATERDERVRAVAVWAPVATLDRYTPQQKERWRRDGYLDAVNTRTGQNMRLGVSVLADLERNRDQLDVQAAARRMGRPLLIVHGEQDLSVPPEEGRRLYEAADPALTELELIPQTGHTFGAVHPFEGSTPALERAITTSERFLRKHLGSP